MFFFFFNYYFILLEESAVWPGPLSLLTLTAGKFLLVGQRGHQLPQVAS